MFQIVAFFLTMMPLAHASSAGCEDLLHAAMTIHPENLEALDSYGVDFEDLGEGGSGNVLKLQKRDSGKSLAVKFYFSESPLKNDTRALEILANLSYGLEVKILTPLVLPQNDRIIFPYIDGQIFTDHFASSTREDRTAALNKLQIFSKEIVDRMRGKYGDCVRVTWGIESLPSWKLSWINSTIDLKNCAFEPDLEVFLHLENFVFTKTGEIYLVDPN